MAEDILFTSELDNKKFKKGLKEAEKETDKFASAVDDAFDKVNRNADKSSGKIGRFAAEMATGFNQALEIVEKAARVVQASFELIEESISGVRIENAFQRLAANAGQSGDEILAAINRASNGTISRLDAMRAANTALQFGVAKTPEEFEKMTKGAIALGRALGVSTNKALEDFTLGAGRGSILILDNLGISAKQLRDEMNRLAQEGFGTSTEGLTDVQRQAIFTEAALSVLNQKASDLGTNMNDTGAQFDQARSGAADLRQEVGELLAIVSALLGSLANAPGGLFDRILGFNRNRSESPFTTAIEQVRELQFTVIDIAASIIGFFQGVKAAADATFEPILLGFRAIEEFLRTGSTDLFFEADRARKEALDIGTQFREGFNEGFTRTQGRLQDRFSDILFPGQGVKGTGNQIGEELSDGLAEGIDTSKAEKKIKDTFDRFKTDASNAFDDLELDFERRLLDELIDNAREREDIARDNRDAIEDIESDHNRRMSELAGDLSQEEAEIVRDGARERIRIDKEEATQRVTILRDFRQELERINNQFNASVAEAERANDAIAFTRAVRERDTSINQAQANRDNQLEENRNRAKEQREALKVELANEIKDVQAANQQKVQALHARLEQELQEQRIANTREIEEQNIVEFRRKQDRERRNTEELEDFSRLQQRKFERLSQSLESEFALLREAETAKTALIQAEEQKRVEVAERAAQRRVAVQARRPSSVIAGGGQGGIPIRHGGGALGAGQTALVHKDETFFRAPSNGVVVPNQLFSPPALRQLGGGGTTINNNGGNANVSMTPDVLNDPIMKQRLIDMVMGELVGGLQ